MMTRQRCTMIAGRGIKPLMFGLLAAGIGSLLFGETGGLLSAISVGLISGCLGQGLSGSGIGGCWGAKSAAVGQILQGSVVLPILYTAAVGLAIICFAKSVHATWRQGLATAQADYEYFYGNARDVNV